ncbi:hypothetical protein [Rohdeia mirabilis]
MNGILLQCATKSACHWLRQGIVRALSSSIALGALVVGNAHAVQLTVVPKSVNFTTSELVIAEDDAGVYVGPQWLDGDFDGQVTSPSADPAVPLDHNYPMHYTSGDQCTVCCATFEVHNPPPLLFVGYLTFTPTANFLGQSWQFAPQTIPWVFTQTTYVTPSFVCQVPFPAGFVLKIPGFTIDWDVELSPSAHGFPASSGTTSTTHRMYVTRHAPQVAALYETLLDTVCAAAHLQSDPVTIGTSVATDFLLGGMTSKAVDGWNRPDARPLTYWQPGASGWKSTWGGGCEC